MEIRGDRAFINYVPEGQAIGLFEEPYGHAVGFVAERVTIASARNARVRGAVLVRAGLTDHGTELPGIRATLETLDMQRSTLEAMSATILEHTAPLNARIA